MQQYVQEKFWERKIAGLRRGGNIFRDIFMADTIPSPVPVANVTAWNEDLIFSVLADPVRRKQLLALTKTEVNQRRA